MQVGKVALFAVLPLAALLAGAAFDSIIVCDNPGGDEGGTDIQGGALGAMMAQNQRREAQLARSTKMIRCGVAITALGSLL